MANLAYRDFMKSVSSDESPLRALTEATPSTHEMNALFLHNLFCLGDDCQWAEEEEELSSPWYGRDHLYWSEVSEKLQAAEIPLAEVARHQAAVLALVGVTLL